MNKHVSISHVIPNTPSTVHTLWIRQLYGYIHNAVGHLLIEINHVFFKAFSFVASRSSYFFIGLNGVSFEE